MRARCTSALLGSFWWGRAVRSGVNQDLNCRSGGLENKLESLDEEGALEKLSGFLDVIYKASVTGVEEERPRLGSDCTFVALTN